MGKIYQDCPFEIRRPDALEQDQEPAAAQIAVIDVRKINPDSWNN